MLLVRRQAGGIKDPELIGPTYQPRHAGSDDLDAIALGERATASCQLTQPPLRIILVAYPVSERILG